MNERGDRFRYRKMMSLSPGSLGYRLKFCLFDWFLNVLVNNKTISRTGSKTETDETEREDHDFCLSRSHYTDTDPISRGRADTEGSSPGVARSTD